MEQRLIDANAYAADLWKLRVNYQMLDDTHTADKIMHGIFKAEQALKEQPTVDAVPVVHARWYRYSYDEAICTHCGYDRGTEFECTKEAVEKWGELPKYCEACGAKMDE